MNNPSKQKLAKDIYGISWSDIQTCTEDAAVRYEDICERLHVFTKEEIIGILMAVIEAQQLGAAYPESDSPFKDLKEFKHW